MPTIPEIKEELDKLEVEYPKDMLKADLEILLALSEEYTGKNINAMIVDPPIVDPNAHPGTQAK